MNSKDASAEAMLNEEMGMGEVKRRSARGCSPRATRFP